MGISEKFHRSFHPLEGGLRYAEVPVPTVSNDNEVLLTVKAAAIKHIDRAQASGKDYSADTKLAGQAKTIGGDGVTGFTDRIAVQIAKQYGASKVIATGRNPKSLQELLLLDADEIISIHQPDEVFLAQIRAIQSSKPIDVILDYLWGRSAKLLLASLKGRGSFTHLVRSVSIGSITGDKFQLSAENLHSVNLQLTDSGRAAGRGRISFTKSALKGVF